MKTGLNRKVFVEGTSMVMLDVWDVKTNEVVFTGAVKAISKFIPCKPTNVSSALRSGSTCQKNIRSNTLRLKQHNGNQLKYDSST
jgi:hypothetical protein